MDDADLLLDDLDGPEEPPITSPASRFRVLLVQQEVVFRADLKQEFQAAMASARALVGDTVFTQAWEHVHESIRQQAMEAGARKS